ncbi:hypothetical protein A3A79_02235 [Candidatus Gottesmanbacteria bacterium RIFCSPLOWO2_01_FULL_43_11b]|uniref:Uncharacterized protein n=1 Tax=Candidatus Gottesmanbacteria bacterium RIFCSPLOWO2_01_FULL_43_11b TaxID=1798392 RepID=A0A1F6AJ54_9BACT|nr:MAG: hypothetical protein A3A79_02235 [Candidatus Gottesmanbacteria bacterium RIFCSPLOWO2_01_FULL_43_11b]
MRRQKKSVRSPTAQQVGEAVVRNGVIGALALLSLFAITMTLLSGFDAALGQFLALWYLMIPLVLGFGIQVSLYTILKQRAKGLMATSGTSASAGMLACCAHHAADVLPILGLSAVATLIAQYQVPILSFTLLINILGIAVMWNHVRKMV